MDAGSIISSDALRRLEEQKKREDEEHKLTMIRAECLNHGICPQCGNDGIRDEYRDKHWWKSSYTWLRVCPKCGVVARYKLGDCSYE